MNKNHFNKQPYLKDNNLHLSPLREADYGGLYLAASDPLIWTGHPVKDRYLEEVFRPYFGLLLESGETLVVRASRNSDIIGCSRYYVPPGGKQGIAIGYTFLRRDHWGGTTNRVLKALMFDHAFKSFDTVWLHIDAENTCSQRATRKLGARFSHEEVLDLSNGKKRTYCYRLARAEWHGATSSN